MKEPQIMVREGHPTPRIVRGLQLRDSADLLVLMLALPVVLLLPVPALRVPLGLAVVLFAPGYALTSALFPRRDDLDGITRVALSFGLSAAAIPLLVLLLDLLSLSISPGPIALSLMVWLTLFCTIALWRRSAIMPLEEASPDPAPAGARARESGHRPISIGTIFGLLAIAVLLVGATAVLLLPDQTEHGTEFYVLGRSGLAEDYPRQAALGEDLQLTMGIANNSPLEHTYRAEVWAVDGQDPQRRALVAEERGIVPPPGQAVEQTISWRMPWPGDNQQIDLLLFAEDSSQPHRQLRLWLDVTESPPAP